MKDLIPEYCPDKKLYGYKNVEGEQNPWVIEPQFENAYPFEKGIAVVKKSGDLCLINKEGDELWIQKLNETGLYKYQYPEGEKWGILDIGNSNEVNKLSKAEYDEIKILDNYLLKFKKDKFWGILDDQGDELTGPYFVDFEIFKAYYDLNGNEVYCIKPPLFQKTSEGFIGKRSKYFIIGILEEGKEIFDIDGVSIFNKVWKDCFLIDNQDYVSAWVFDGNKWAVIKLTKEWELLEKKEHRRVGFLYDAAIPKIVPDSGNKIVEVKVKLDGKWGISLPDLTWKIPVEFDEMKDYDGNYYVVKIHNPVPLWRLYFCGDTPGLIVNGPFQPEEFYLKPDFAFEDDLPIETSLSAYDKKNVKIWTNSA